ITKADKGNMLVVLDKTFYDKKVEEHIKSGPYSEITTKKVETVMNRCKEEAISYIKSIYGKVPNAIWYSTMPKSTLAPRFYGLPKIHK
ncbi:MAG: hypothetical protein ACRCT5_02330, partial [Tannerellaceae bacterium]